MRERVKIIAARARPVRDKCTGWCKVQRHRIASLIVRPLIWFLAVAIAAFPAVHVSGAAYFPLLLRLRIEEMGEAAIKAGFFRDFFFVVIVVAILAICNMVDSVLRTHGEIGYFSRLCFIVLGIFFLMILVFGTSNFVYLAHLEGSNLAGHEHDYNIIQTTLVAGLLTEIIIALREPLAHSDVVPSQESPP